MHSGLQLRGDLRLRVPQLVFVYMKSRKLSSLAGGSTPIPMPFSAGYGGALNYTFIL